MHCKIQKQKKDVIVTSKAPNNCVFIGDIPCIVDRIEIDSGTVYGHQLVFSRPLYDTPFPYSSQLLGIGYFVKGRQIIKGIPTNIFSLLHHTCFVYVSHR